ncbi:hypothetical protein ACOME3_005060 [Neoechinorhynchus agilis]
MANARKSRFFIFFVNSPAKFRIKNKLDQSCGRKVKLYFTKLDWKYHVDWKLKRKSLKSVRGLAKSTNTTFRDKYFKTYLQYASTLDLSQNGITKKWNTVDYMD